MLIYSFSEVNKNKNKYTTSQAVYKDEKKKSLEQNF